MSRGVRRFSFAVEGEPRPAGSKRFVGISKAGKGILTDANPHARDWKARVAYAASQEWRRLGRAEPWTGPLRVEFTFRVSRPASHFNSRGLVKPTAPLYPVKRPDVLKLARAVEDCLSGVIYRDDSQIVIETLNKVWAGGGYVEGVWITIETLEVEND